MIDTKAVRALAESMSLCGCRAVSRNLRQCADEIDALKEDAERYKTAIENEQIHAENAVLRNIVETFPSIEKDLDGYLQRAFAAENERDALKEDAAQIRAQERKRIHDLLIDAMQDDLENGVEWLNEHATQKFFLDFPALNKVIREMGDD